MATYRRLILLIGILLLSACSSQYAYRLADWWLENQIEEYLDLNKEQQQKLAEAIDGWHVWHQQEELPRYQEILASLQQKLEQGEISPEQILKLEEQAQSAWKRLLHKAGPLLAELTLDQDEKQRQQLYKQIEENNEELSEKFSDRSAEERRERGRKGMEKQAKEYLGKLNPEQKTRIKQWSEEFQLGAEIELSERLRWQEQFRAILEAPRDEHSQGKLMALFDNPRESWTEEKRQLTDINRPLQRQLFSDLLKLSSDKQKARLLKTLKKYQKLLEKMAQQKL